MGRRDTDSGSSGSPMIYYMQFIGPYSGYYAELRRIAQIADEEERKRPPAPIPQSDR